METQTNDPFAAMVAAKTQEMPTTPWHSIWLFGSPGTGKTRFALGAWRCAGPVAYIGTESSAEDYIDDPQFPGFSRANMLEVRSIADYRKAVEAVIASGKYKTVVIDTMSDVYGWEVQEAERTKDGKKYVPMNAWKDIKDGHKKYLRMLRDSPIHKVYVSQEREITVSVKGEDGMIKLETIGFKIDAEKKDGHVIKVVLRMARKEGKFVAEVYKDRLSRASGYKAGDVVVEPKIEMWLKENK